MDPILDKKIVAEQLQFACSEIERRVLGQKTVIRHAIAAFAAGGHILFEDVPGTGKTTLASAIARVLGLQFTRVQGTPDLMPAELTGTQVFHPGTAEFQFRPGPIFTQVLLLDEINRATPRTQSALLEAMAEGHVSVDGQTYPLATPFFVMATANPIESQGVFPLPEAQLDRFLVRLRLGYTTEDEEISMVQQMRLKQAPTLTPVFQPEDLPAILKHVSQVTVSADAVRYIVRLCRATREHEGVELGASPRAVLALTAFAQALALLSNRSYVTPDDVQEAWLPVLQHRVKAHMEWRSGGAPERTKIILQKVPQLVKPPTEFAHEV